MIESIYLHNVPEPLRQYLDERKCYSNNLSNGKCEVIWQAIEETDCISCMFDPDCKSFDIMYFDQGGKWYISIIRDQSSVKVKK